MTIDFWFDPGCPFCWRTSRWLSAVAPERGAAISWHSISLFEKSRGNDSVPEEARSRMFGAHRLLRVVEALRQAGGEELIGPFYTEVGTLMHHDSMDPAQLDVAVVLEKLGADPALARAGDDSSMDEAIRESMHAGLSKTGEDVGTPLIGIGDTVYFGPVIAPVLTGDDALRLFDAWLVLVQLGTFWEMKRSHEAADMTLPSRPAGFVDSSTGTASGRTPRLDSRHASR